MIIVASALLLAMALSLFVFRFAVIDGDSMKGTIDNGDIVIVSLNSYRKNEPKRDDVIIFKRDDITKGRIVKRIVAISGDVIEIKDGFLFINGEIYKKDFYRFDESENLSPVTIPSESCFVIGDNYRESNDSRVWDDRFVKYEDIDGKVSFRIFPKMSSID